MVVCPPQTMLWALFSLRRTATSASLVVKAGSGVPVPLPCSLPTSIKHAYSGKLEVMPFGDANVQSLTDHQIVATSIALHVQPRFQPMPSKSC